MHGAPLTELMHLRNPTENESLCAAVHRLRCKQDSRPSVISMSFCPSPEMHRTLRGVYEGRLLSTEGRCVK